MFIPSHTRSTGAGFAAVTRWTLGHRRTVILFWLALAVIGLATSGRASAALSHDFSLPGRESTTANQQILRTYGSGGDARPLVPVLTLPRGTTVRSPGVRAELTAALSRVGRAVPGARTASFADTGDRGFVSADGRTTFALVYPPRHGAAEDPAATALPKVRSALSGARVAGASFALTGKAALDGAEAASSGNGVLTETLIAGVGALVVLVLVFGSALAMLPLAMAVVSIPTTFLLTWAITQVTPVSFITQFLISLIGLGVAIDYALLVVMRWREERAHGHADAVERAMRTAGSAVVFSGTTVAVGLAALIALPVPFLRSVGYAGLLIPLVSVAVATTLLPVLLSLAGARMDRHRLPFGHRAGGDAAPSRAWMRWARLVLRRRWIAAGCGLALVGLLLASALTLHIGDSPADDTGGAAGRGVAALRSTGIGTGTLGPSEVITGGDPARTADRLHTVPGVRTAIAPTDWRRGGTAVIEVIPRADAGSAAGTATLHRIRDTVAALPSARLGGEPAATADFIHAVYGSFPLMIGLIALVTFLLLVRAFRSIVLPLKALLMDVLSIGAAWGVLAFVWQHGHGSSAIWGIDATGAVTAWVPLMVFAFLFGLSMDYEVFLLTRIREEHDAGASTNVAVERGMGHTARLITFAVLILVLALVSLTAVPQTDVKVLATGLAAGILLDATIIRAILVPALLSLFDRANWWLPAFAHRALRLRPAQPEIDVWPLSVSRTD